MSWKNLEKVCKPKSTIQPMPDFLSRSMVLNDMEAEVYKINDMEAEAYKINKS